MIVVNLIEIWCCEANTELWQHMHEFMFYKYWKVRNNNTQNCLYFCSSNEEGSGKSSSNILCKASSTPRRDANVSSLIVLNRLGSFWISCSRWRVTVVKEFNDVKWQDSSVSPKSISWTGRRIFSLCIKSLTADIQSLSIFMLSLVVQFWNFW